MSKLTTEKLTELKGKAKEIRINSLKAITNAKSGHPGGSLSIADILSVLYFELMKYDPKNPGSPERDYLVVSKGHASPAIYSALGLAGFFDVEEFVADFRQVNKKFQGHIDRLKVPGVEVSTGSLGHGLSVAQGIALGLRLDKKPNHVFAILSDGELQEGQSWEAIMAGNHYQTGGNLTVIIDRNRIQLDGFTEDTMRLEPLSEKFKAFGWEVTEIDGHDLEQVYEALTNSMNKPSNSSPSVVIANTIKGKGVSFMEDQVKWHGSPPKPEDLELALKELG